MTSAIKEVRIGLATCGIAAGAERVRTDLCSTVQELGLDVAVKAVGCIGMCYNEPLIEVGGVDGRHTLYGHVDEQAVTRIVEEHLADGRPVDELAVKEDGFFADQVRIVLENCGVIDPESLAEYRDQKGYKALCSAVTEMTPEQVVEEITASKLRGRGGGGFPTGLKWSLDVAEPGPTKYMICNADEGDPGAFMDRRVLEGDPHRVLEGMIIAAYAIGASFGYIYVRAEYPLAIFRLEKAIAAGRRCLECGCMAVNDCELRDYSTEIEAEQETCSGEVPHKQSDARHPFIVREAGKCVLCGRCLRICADLCAVAAISFTDRGIDTEIQVPFNRAWQDSACVSCGACVDVCPTGALYDRTASAKQIPLQLDETRTMCMLCGLGCEIKVRSLSGTYMQTVPGNGNVPCGGKSVLCARGRYGWHTLADARRIKTPMIRCGRYLIEVSWNEALDEAAQRLGTAAGSVALLGAGLLTNEEGWLVTQIGERLGTHSPTFDPAAFSHEVAIPFERIASIEEISDAELIIGIGPRGGREKVVLDALLHQAVAKGSCIVSVGAQHEIDSESLLVLLDALNQGDCPPEMEPLVKIAAAAGLLIVFEERTVEDEPLAQIAAFLTAAPTGRQARNNRKLVTVPATANAVGLRSLGFTEGLRPAAKAWLTIGADPLGAAVGRQRLLNVEMLIAMSPIVTATTEQAHVLFPMRLPLETRGHIVGLRGPRPVAITAKSPLELETWEILVQLAVALKVETLPKDFTALVAASAHAVTIGGRARVAARTTPAVIAAMIDKRLAERLSD